MQDRGTIPDAVNIGLMSCPLTYLNYSLPQNNASGMYRDSFIYLHHGTNFLLKDGYQGILHLKNTAIIQVTMSMEVMSYCNVIHYKYLKSTNVTNLNRRF